MKRARTKPAQGRKAITHRVKGTPQTSAKKPSTATPRPPIPKDKPRIKPEAMPTFWGMKDWPITMETEKEKIRIKPARINQINDQTPEARRKRTKRGTAQPRLKRIVFLWPKRSASGPPTSVPTVPAVRKAKRRLTA